MMLRVSGSARAQGGMALISALLLLLVVTILAVTMFRSYGVEEKIAGNTREKQRALNAAVSAQNYAEWYLKQGTIPVATSCTAIVPAATPQICSPPAGPGTSLDFSQFAWTAGVDFTPFTTNEGGNVAGATVTGLVTTTPGTTNTYYSRPLFYITDLGASTNPKGEMYQIDAIGYGGGPNSVAVVESTYLISTPGPIDPSI